MPSTRLQLEGSDLEELLDRVKREHGEAARILQAEKVRTGGLGGFFARERYQIDIEVDGDTAPAGPGPKSAPAAPAAPASPAAPARSAAPTSVLDLAESLNERERELAEPSPQVRRVPAPSRPAPAEPASFSEVLARRQEDQAAAAPSLNPARSPASLRVTERPSAPLTPPSPAAPSAPTAPPSLPVRQGPPQEPAVIAGPSPVAAAAAFGLAPLPVPPGADLAAADAYRALMRSLRSLPTVPPPAYAPGQVVAVIGEGDRALRVAAGLAQDLGVDPALVLVAAPPGSASRVPVKRRLTDPADIASRRSRWARRQESTIVVIEAGMLLRPEGWARAVLSGLAPTFTWAAVAATTKVVDVDAWAEKLGRIDALAVDGVEATVEPASILASAIPVGMVDGRRATPAVWAGLLAERLAG